MTANRRAILLMLVFVFLWAGIEAMAANVLRHYSPYQVVWTRYAVHLALMAALWGWREPASLWQTRRPVFHVGRSLLMLGMPASWVIGMQMGVSGHAVMTIFWISPLLILGLAWVFLQDRVPPLVWLATCVACAGGLLVNGLHGLPGASLLIYPLGMALCFSAYVVMTRSLRTETTRTNLFYTAAGVFVVLTPAMPGLWIMPSLPDLLVMVVIGLLGYVTLLALDRSAAAAPVSISAPFAYLQIAFTVPLFWVAGLGHDMSVPRMALGLLLIVGAALCLWLREPRLNARDAVMARSTP